MFKTSDDSSIDCRNGLSVIFNFLHVISGLHELPHINCVSLNRISSNYLSFINPSLGRS